MVSVRSFSGHGVPEHEWAIQYFGQHQRHGESSDTLQPTDFPSELFDIHQQLEDAIANKPSRLLDVLAYNISILTCTLFSPDSEKFFPCHSPNSQSQSSPHPPSDTGDLDLCRLFSPLATVCAMAYFILPSHILADGSRLANHFLKASRSCLNLQQDSDIESPISSSIIIRCFHSNYIHAIGKAKVSWFLLGEAIRLAQAMCVHHEYALENMDPVEAQLRRNIFWQLHTGDNSAALLNNRPFILHEFILRDHISACHAPPDGDSLLDTTRSHNTEPYEIHLMQSFHLCQNLWSLGAKLLLDFQLLQPFCTSTSPDPPPLTVQQTSAILDAYVQFLSFTDDVLAWLHEIEEPADVTDANQVYQRAPVSGSNA